MGQYWIPVNLDRREFIDPHKLGTGLKLWAQLANSPGTGAALLILTAAMPERRGGGDFDLTENWHGPERKDMTREGPKVPEYEQVAARTIGRWAGDRIALIGDYAEPGDIRECAKRTGRIGPRRATPNESAIYGLCYAKPGTEGAFADISDDVCAVIEHELTGKFVGDGWRVFKPNENAA